MTRQDVEWGCAMAWETRTSAAALKLLRAASTSGVDISRQSVYSAMKCFCHDSRYEDIQVVLETVFPPGKSPDPFLPPDRFKWQCRVFCEQLRPQQALDLVKTEMPRHSRGSDFIPALRTIMQTCSKLRRPEEVLAAYDLYVSIRSEGAEAEDESPLLGNDLLSVFRAARALNRHSLACGILSQWHEVSKLATKNDIIPSAVQFCQGIMSATSARNFTAAHEFLAHLHATGSANTSSIAVGVACSNLLQNGVPGFHQSMEVMHKLGVSPRSEHFTLQLASKSMNASSQLMVLEAMLEANIAPENKAVAIVLQSCFKTHMSAAALRMMAKLRSSGYPLNQYHYSIMVKIYGEMRQPYEALNVLREAQKRGIAVDLRFFATVIDALGSQVSSNRNRVSPEAESHEIALANICYKLLDEALTSLRSAKSSRGKGRGSVDVSEVLTVFHTAMKPASRLGDYEKVSTLMRGLHQMSVPISNITMSCVIQAYTAAGKLLDAQTTFDRFISEGKRPNGIVLCILLNALSKVGRYYESWLLFVNYCQKMGIPVVVKYSDGRVAPFMAVSHSDYYSNGKQYLLNEMYDFE